MINSMEQAIAVQQRRRLAGKKGRAKAVRRWFKHTYGGSLDMYSPLSLSLPAGLKDALQGDFEGCRSFDEARRPVLQG